MKVESCVTEKCLSVLCYACCCRAFLMSRVDQHYCLHYLWRLQSKTAVHGLWRKVTLPLLLEWRPFSTLSRLVALAFCLCCNKIAIVSCYLATVPQARKGCVPVGRASFNHLANLQRWKQTRPQLDLISTMRPFQVSLLIKSCQNHWAQRGKFFFFLFGSGGSRDGGRGRCLWINAYVQSWDFNDVSQHHQQIQWLRCWRKHMHAHHPNQLPSLVGGSHFNLKGSSTFPSR